MCFTHSECKSFRFESIPQKSDCDQAEEADCNGSKCKLLTEEVINDEGLLDASGKYIYGAKEICTESVSQAVKDYFYDQDSRYHAAKRDFINAKYEYEWAMISVPKVPEILRSYFSPTGIISVFLNSETS